MKLNILICALAATALGPSLFVQPAPAAESAASPQPRREWRQQVKEKLGLTDDQIRQIKAQFQSEKSHLVGLLRRLHDARAQLRAEIQKPGATDSTVREAAARVSAVESDLAVERLTLFRKISPILTDEQRRKLGQFQAALDGFVARAIRRLDARRSHRTAAAD